MWGELGEGLADVCEFKDLARGGLRELVGHVRGDKNAGEGSGVEKCSCTEHDEAGEGWQIRPWESIPAGRSSSGKDEISPGVRITTGRRFGSNGCGRGGREGGGDRELNNPFNVVVAGDTTGDKGKLSDLGGGVVKLLLEWKEYAATGDDGKGDTGKGIWRGERCWVSFSALLEIDVFRRSGDKTGVESVTAISCSWYEASSYMSCISM
jgi:hypothetical protein